MLKRALAVLPIIVTLAFCPAAAHTVLVTNNGQSFSFDSANCISAGSYIDPERQFTQDDLVCMRSDTPITVSFRPDENSTRLEVVLENFRSYGVGNAAAANIGALTLSIDGGAPISVPSLNWASEWRWQSSPRPIRHTIAQLIAAKTVLPRTVFPGSYPTIDWSKAAFNPSMDTSGDRFDIGIDTEWAANAILTQTPVALAGVVALAETAQQMPMHVRDDATFGPVDFIVHPDLDWYWQPGYSHPIETWIKLLGASSGYTLDYSHFPDVSSLAFQLTGDPYFLEQLQYRETWAMGFNGVGNDVNGIRLIYENQPRGWAWTLRDLFRLAKYTPATGTGWLKNQAYWQRLLDAERTHFTATFVNDPLLAKWGSGPWSSTYSFQDDFAIEAIGLGVYLGFPEWQPAYDFKLVGLDARTNGTSGWPRQEPTIYYANLGPVSSQSYTPGYVWFSDWGAVWAAYYAQKNADGTSANAINPQPWSDTTSFQSSGRYSYLIETRNALAIAALNGKFAGKDNLAFVTIMANQLGVADARRSVGTDVASAPPSP